MVREFYFSHNAGRVNSSSLLEYTQLLSDISFVYGIDRAVKVHAKSSSTGRTFYYRYTYYLNTITIEENIFATLILTDFRL